MVFRKIRKMLKGDKMLEQFENAEGKVPAGNEVATKHEVTKTPSIRKKGRSSLSR